MGGAWERLGRILRADGSHWWLQSHTGAASVVPAGGDVVDVYLTARDARNRSVIGRGRLDLRRPGDGVVVEPDPVLEPGVLGAFDENGVSYPCLVEAGGALHLYYTGWMPSVLTPFQNHMGLAVRGEDGHFRRVSRAPILPRTDADYLCTGAMDVLVEAGRWRMWYVSWTGWGTRPGEPKHTYLIKYAESDDGRTWRRDDTVCIAPTLPGEHSISRPSVVELDGVYHMWFCRRGDRYRLGYAVSDDGIAWERRDDEVGIEPSGDGWDSSEMAYPHVFRHGDLLYLLYAGNDFGDAGLGLARRPVSDLR